MVYEILMRIIMNTTRSQNGGSIGGEGRGVVDEGHAFPSGRIVVPA